MRIIFIVYTVLIATATLLQAAPGHSQGLERHLSVSYQNTDLHKIMLDLRKRSGLDFAFMGDLGLENIRIAKMEFRDEPLADILRSLLSDQPIGFMEKEGTIYLSQVRQQSGKITGKITDTKGNPLPGASVKITELNRSISADEQGNFSFSVTPGTYSIEVSFVSFRSQKKAGITVETDKNSAVNFQLEEVVGELDEVVAIGYGTVAKRDLTGSVSSVKASEITAYVTPDPVMALQGRVAGVQVSMNTGAPDGNYNIRIRGVNSIRGNNAPLYIVDGIPFSMYTINAYEIESIEVLKDASATAIYGSRGANGVILITTK